LQFTAWKSVITGIHFVSWALQELQVDTVPLLPSKNFHLEVIHQSMVMVKYLFYPFHGARHLVVNASQNWKEIITRKLQKIRRQLLQEIHNIAITGNLRVVITENLQFTQRFGDLILKVRNEDHLLRESRTWSKRSRNNHDQCYNEDLSIFSVTSYGK